MGINSIKVKKVIRPLDLGDFQPEYKGTVIEVWVNPPVSVKFALPDLLREWQGAIAKRVLLEKPLTEEEKKQGITAEERTAQIDFAKDAETVAKRALYEWFSQVWQDSPIEDVMEMVDRLEIEDPALLMFMRDRTVRMVNEYYVARKKA